MAQREKTEEEEGDKGRSGGRGWEKENKQAIFGTSRVVGLIKGPITVNLERPGWPKQPSLIQRSFRKRNERKHDILKMESDGIAIIPHNIFFS